jgi:hypothetical protein
MRQWEQAEGNSKVVASNGHMQELHVSKADLGGSHYVLISADHFP